MRPDNFYNINNVEAGIPRELAPDVTTTVYTGDQAMISIVRFVPDGKGKLHHHPKEQGGFCLEGSGKRIQGNLTVDIAKGDFSRTPSNVPHTVEAGPGGLRVIDAFAPPRRAYETAGNGFGDSF